jgi:DNA-binding GntR family transcriptional regulator
MELPATASSGKRKKTAARERIPLATRAYEAIKNRIITVKYTPGEYLNETLISETLKIGRTPVHQAIHRLAQEGLVDVIPRKGVIVRPVSLDEIAQIIDVRLINEPFCAAQAARRASRADLEIPKAILDAAQRELDEGNGVEELMRLDRRFHTWIAQTSGNSLLAEILMQLHDRSARLWFLSLSEGEHPHRVHAEHTEILRAIGMRDEALAANKARLHIESFRNTILRVV